jgi:hypothetical protein
MLHALTLGLTHVRRYPDDMAARGAVGVLEGAIAFLGVKPPKGGRSWDLDER